MGSANYHILATKDERHLRKLPLPSSLKADGPQGRPSLRKKLLKVKNICHRLKVQGSPDGYPCSIKHQLIPDLLPEEMQKAEPPIRRDVEVIEIPDDDVISINSKSERQMSLVPSGIDDSFNRPSPHQRRNAQGHYDYERSQPVDEDEWGSPYSGLDLDVQDALWGLDIPPSPRQTVSKSLPRYGPSEIERRTWQAFMDDRNRYKNSDRLSPQELTFGLGEGRFDGPASQPPGTSNCQANFKVECVDDVVAIFPDICRDYVSGLYDAGVGEIAEPLIAHILDKMDKGTEYPKAKDKLRSLKRKREVDEDEEAAKEYGRVDRENPGVDYAHITRAMLSGEFSHTPMAFIDATLNQTRHHLFPAYRVLEEAERTWNPERPPYNKIKQPRKMKREYREEEVELALKSEATTQQEMLAMRELKAARRARKKADNKRQAERRAELDEEENIRKAIAEGTMVECGCCFSDYPLNRMVHCDNEDVLHWFCRGCAKQTAETEIGNSKYELKCMSMDGCKFGFSKEQKSQFLDEKTLIALDRNEQEANLRMAGIENLASCPFCPFAAEYPPVEEDRLFHCQNQDCEKVSCRLCKLESHIPKTCEENAKDNGLSVRRQIEEAMSAALIRKCNKCGTPFVKEEGCNKMTCTRGGCYNVQCYVCSKSCSYDHFNDRSRGGKPGNCPLFESVEVRHEEEVKKAEKEALEKVRAEHPEYSEEDLKIKVSDNVKRDEERRKANDPRNNHLGVAPQILQFAGPPIPLIPVVPQALRPLPPAQHFVPGQPPAYLQLQHQQQVEHMERIRGLMQVNGALAQRMEHLVPGVARPLDYLRQMAFEIPALQPLRQAGPVVAGPAAHQAARGVPVPAIDAELQAFRREVMRAQRQQGQPGQPDQLEPPPRMPLRNAARRGR